MANIKTNFLNKTHFIIIETKQQQKETFIQTLFFLINLKIMINLTLTICLSVMVSLAYSQIHVVTPNGDVGIGTTNPTQKFDVVVI